MAAMDEIAALHVKIDSHVQWDVMEHSLLRKEHETDNRILVQAVNDLRVAVEKGVNKVIVVICGALVSTIVGTVIFVIPHIH